VCSGLLFVSLKCFDVVGWSTGRACKNFASLRLLRLAMVVDASGWRIGLYCIPYDNPTCLSTQPRGQPRLRQGSPEKWPLKLCVLTSGLMFMHRTS